MLLQFHRKFLPVKQHNKMVRTVACMPHDAGRFMMLQFLALLTMTITGYYGTLRQFLSVLTSCKLLVLSKVDLPAHTQVFRILSPADSNLIELYMTCLI